MDYEGVLLVDRDYFTVDDIETMLAGARRYRADPKKLRWYFVRRPPGLDLTGRTHHLECAGPCRGRLSPMEQMG